jgi:rhodanese-related sulfurtransferase
MNLFKMIKAMFTSAPRAEPLDCAARLRSGAAVLVDVREPAEWAEGVAQNAVLLPLSDLTGGRLQWTPFLSHHRERELFVYCRSGGRSAIAARILAAEGFRAANTGSLTDWSAAAWPVVPPAKSRR